MLNSVKVPYPQCIQTLLDHIELDPGFRQFHIWAKENNVPIIVLSSGMNPIIRALLEKLIGPDANDIEIVSNDIKPRPGMTIEQPGGWEIVYHDDSGFGHDKSLAIRPYVAHISKMPEDERPTLLYAGDGVSDLSAARETDLLFAKKGHDLITYCERQGFPFTIFSDWSDILAVISDILSGKTSVNKVATEGAEIAKREGKEEKTTK